MKWVAETKATRLKTLGTNQRASRMSTGKATRARRMTERCSRIAVAVLGSVPGLMVVFSRKCDQPASRCSLLSFLSRESTAISAVARAIF